MNMNPMQMIQAFNDFRSKFRGDPEQTVNQLVASGRMSQSQLNQLQQMARQFMNILNIR